MSAKLPILPFWGLSRCRFDARVAPPGAPGKPDSGLMGWRRPRRWSRFFLPLCYFVVLFWLNSVFFDQRSSARICGKSLFFNIGDLGNRGNSGNFRPTPSPTPYVDPIPPKTTQCHPRLRGQAEGRNPKMQKPDFSSRVSKIKKLWTAGACPEPFEWAPSPAMLVPNRLQRNQAFESCGAFCLID
jgi:hypothetical protein